MLWVRRVVVHFCLRASTRGALERLDGTGGVETDRQTDRQTDCARVSDGRALGIERKDMAERKKVGPVGGTFVLTSFTGVRGCGAPC